MEEESTLSEYDSKAIGVSINSQLENLYDSLSE